MSPIGSTASIWTTKYNWTQKYIAEQWLRIQNTEKKGGKSLALKSGELTVFFKNN